MRRQTLYRICCLLNWNLTKAKWSPTLTPRSVYPTCSETTSSMVQENKLFWLCSGPQTEKSGLNAVLLYRKYLFFLILSLGQSHASLQQNYTLKKIITWEIQDWMTDGHITAPLPKRRGSKAPFGKLPSCSSSARYLLPGLRNGSSLSLLAAHTSRCEQSPTYRGTGLLAKHCICPIFIQLSS